MRPAEQVTLDFMHRKPRQCSRSGDAGSAAVSERASSVVMSNDGDLQNGEIRGRLSSKPCESSTESEPVLQSQDYINFAEVSSASSSVNENECVSDGDDTDLRLSLGSFRDKYSVLRRVPLVELDLLEPKEKAVQGLHRTATNLAIPSGAMPPHKTGFKRALGEARGELSPGANMASSAYKLCQRTVKTEYQQATFSPIWSASKCTGVYPTLEDGKRLDQSERCNSALAELPSAKGQAVGWPPIRTYRKNVHTVLHTQPKGDGEGHSKLYVKVNMDGIPIGRKVDLNVYGSYESLMIALEEMFCISSNGMFVLTYEDKEGDWMLVGDVPWGMFVSSVRRLRIVRGS